MQSEGNVSRIGILVYDYKLLKKKLFVCECNLGEVQLLEILSDPSATWIHSPLLIGQRSSWEPTEHTGEPDLSTETFVTWVHPKGMIPKPDTTF